MKRLPTKEEFRELIDKCNWTWATIKNINGYTVTGPNGNSIFLPAAGIRDGNIHKVGWCGYYWSSSLGTDHSDSGYYLYFYFGSRELYFHHQLNSQTVRLVSDTEGIDLGLSIRWMPCNEGTDNPEESGNYYTFDESIKLFNQDKIMKENTVTINVPSGKVAQQTTDENGNIIIKFVDPEPVRSKSWKEFCENHPDFSHEYQLDSNGGVALVGWSNHRRWVENRQLLQTEEDAEGILALIQLTRLHDEWVGDWKPDYSVREDTKYEIVMQSNRIQTTDWSTLQSLLTFPTIEMADEFLQCFGDLIEKAKKFI